MCIARFSLSQISGAPKSRQSCCISHMADLALAVYKFPVFHHSLPIPASNESFWLKKLSASTASSSSEYMIGTSICMLLEFAICSPLCRYCCWLNPLTLAPPLGVSPLTKSCPSTLVGSGSGLVLAISLANPFPMLPLYNVGPNNDLALPGTSLAEEYSKISQNSDRSISRLLAGCWPWEVEDVVAVCDAETVSESVLNFRAYKELSQSTGANKREWQQDKRNR